MLFTNTQMSRERKHSSRPMTLRLDEIHLVIVISHSYRWN